VKRCNDSVILIIFTVNSFEFVYFFFKSGDVTKGGSDSLCLLSLGSFRIEQSVTNCVGECVPCN